MLLRASKCILRRTLTDINKWKTESNNTDARNESDEPIAMPPRTSKLGAILQFTHESQIEHPSG